MLRAGKRNGAPGRSRTSDLLVRSQLLYPAELRAHIAFGCNSLTILEFAVQSKRAPQGPNASLEEMVRPEGLEPPTLWFEGIDSSIAPVWGDLHGQVISSDWGEPSLTAASQSKQAPATFFATAICRCTLRKDN